MAKWLKQAISKQDKDEAQQQVRETVEKLLADIETRGDTAVRELSKRFDNWEPEKFKLSEEQIQDCINRLDTRTLDDIRFAQDQIRNFAQLQRDSMKDVEEETLPGGDPRPPSHPNESGGVLCARREIPDGRFRPHVGGDCKSGRGQGNHYLRPALPGQTRGRYRRSSIHGGCRCDLCDWRCAGGGSDGFGHREHSRRGYAGRARKRLCCRSKAATLRQGRDRSFCRTDRNPSDCR